MVTTRRGRALAVVPGVWVHGSYPFADAEGARLGRSRVWRFLATWAGLAVLAVIAPGSQKRETPARGRRSSVHGAGAAVSA